MPTGNLYKRGSTWYYRVSVKGQEYRGTLRTSNRGDAERRAKAEIERIEKAARFGEGVTWLDAVVMWREHTRDQLGPRTLQRYSTSFKMCRDVLAPYRVDAIDGAAIAGLIAVRRKAKASPATIRRDLTAISSVLTFCEGANLCEGNPTLTKRRTLKERRDPITLPDPADIEFVLGLASARFSAYIRAAWLTGCRQAELAAVTWRDFKPGGRTLRVQGKGNKVRVVDLSADAAAHISAQPRTIGTGLIFVTTAGEGFRQPGSDFSHLMRLAVSQAAKEGREFRRFRFHDLRHLHAVEALRRGASIYDLSQHLGHTSVKTTEIYLAHLTPDEQKEAKASAQNPAQWQRSAM